MSGDRVELNKLKVRREFLFSELKREYDRAHKGGIHFDVVVLVNLYCEHQCGIESEFSARATEIAELDQRIEELQQEVFLPRWRAAHGIIKTLMQSGRIKTDEQFEKAARFFTLVEEKLAKDKVHQAEEKKRPEIESNKRFLVALSFPGEHREFVAKVAQRLSQELGQPRVLYDRFHEAEFARPNLDTHLQTLYHDESELVVVFLCADYERKEWPGLEWRAIRDLIKKKQASSIMLIRLDDANVSGVFSTDGYIRVEGRTPTDIAALIIGRLRILEAERQALSPSSSVPTRGREHVSNTFGLAEAREKLKAAAGEFNRNNFEAAVKFSEEAANLAKAAGDDQMERQAIRFLTRFVGREAEITQVIENLRNKRLVTLRGMGGIGKTRLADAVAARVSEQFEDGVFFTELANVGDSQESVVSELVGNLDVKVAGFPDEATALLTTLQNRKLLLVLDNFEAVMSAAPLVSRLLKACPNVHILITSQRLLGVAGEQQIEVLPMAVASPHPSLTPESLVQLDSFQLFCDRARLKKPSWDLTLGEAPLVAEILDLTDGIPLSIELIAAWLDRIVLTELRDGLKKKRLEYLKRSGPSVEERRHASMRACIDWSFDLLPREEKNLFPKLSVFSGGFFAGDAAQVCQVKNAAPLLDSLRQHSLLMWDESLGETRYRMLPTVQEYAVKKLRKEARRLRFRHAQHFLEILERAGKQIQGKAQIAAITRITAHLDNIRSGMETAIENRNHRMVVRYSGTFSDYLQKKAQFSESLLRSRQGLEAAEALNNKHLVAAFQNYMGAAYLHLPTGDLAINLQKAIGGFEAALRVFTEGDFPEDWAIAQNNLGSAFMALRTGNRGANLKKAITYCEAALRIFTEHKFPVRWASTQTNLGNAYRDLPTGDRGVNLQKAIAFYDAALRVRTEGDFPMDWANTQENQGIAYAQLPIGNVGANLQNAIASFDAALRVYTEGDFPMEWARIQNNLGGAYANLPTGDRDANLRKAIHHYEAALRVRTEHDFPAQWARTQGALGIVYLRLPTGDREADLRKAIASFDAALRVCTEDNFPLEWARIQNNLGNAYANLPTGDRGTILQEAINHYEAALRVFTESDFPVDWARTQANASYAYANLPVGDRRANVKKAIACCEAAIKGYESAELAEEANHVKQMLASLKRQI